MGFRFEKELKLEIQRLDYEKRCKAILDGLEDETQKWRQIAFECREKTYEEYLLTQCRTRPNEYLRFDCDRSMDNTAICDAFDVFMNSNPRRRAMRKNLRFVWDCNLTRSFIFCKKDIWDGSFERWFEGMYHNVATYELDEVPLLKKDYQYFRPLLNPLNRLFFQWGIHK